MTREQIQAEINALEQVEHVIETNEGTYGLGDCQRAGVSGDPKFSTRNVYETVGGVRRESGPTIERTPGRMRRINCETMADDRKRLADLRRQMRSE